ncbi:hypothetical protein ANCDUO_01305 [Ancylostoma duodenale]|uniref:Uncharacterized protein n=1 Tax=Ancylostoma duodenale TaxID=51022 RepID=A0A0C2H3I0_9BILA|nr:hypothetical protein ANCDUO_01305 [Ancylostoma duodenale]
MMKKAPECIPLLNDLISKLSSFSSELDDKRKRSIVIYGVKESDKGLPAIERQKQTEKQVESILNVLDIEARPVEIFRMGKPSDGRPRLIKALRNSHKLRDNPAYSGIFLRRSKIKINAEEREDRALRAEARDLNAKEGSGRKIYVVYRQRVVKTSEITSRNTAVSKN